MVLSGPPRTGALLLLAGLAGCASASDFPSLAPRPAELADNPAPAEPPPPAGPVDSALAGRIAQLATDARQGQAEFEAEVGKAQAAVRRAGGAGSDSWIEAQQAVSRLESARTKTMNALAELDALARERSALPSAAQDLPAIASASAEAEQLAQRQREAIDRLLAALPER
jgi:hypothetical protein